MLDILDNFLENSFVPIYGITLIVAMYRYPKYFDTTLKYIPILILYTFLNDLLGDLIYKYDAFSLTVNLLYNDYYFVIYNIYNIVFFAYFVFLFFQHIESLRCKKVIRLIGLLFLVVSLVNPLFQNFFLEYQYPTFFTGSILLIFCISRYLYEDYKERVAGVKEKNILFFLGWGLLIYHISYLPIKAIRFYNGITGNLEAPLLRRVHLILILVMYTLFIVGFLKMKKRLVRLS